MSEVNADPTHWLPRLSWAVLALLLVALTAGALTIDRSRWPSLVGDEATYMMQAESLAWDGDLRYARRDFDRFVAHHRRPPEGLILQSGDQGERITFGKPFFYALFLAPFARLDPVAGPFVANALLLALASLWVARTLARRIGPLAPLWVAVFVFASVSFAYAFWVHADLFLMCLTAIALALAFNPGTRRRGWRTAGRWLVVGLLLAVVGYSRPMYMSLFLPALIAVPRGERRWGIPALAAGGLVLSLGAATVHLTLTGSWTSYGAERRGFYASTGYPEVDFPSSAWEAKLRQLGVHSWGRPEELVRTKKVVPSLWAWNAVYLLVGRHVGLLPYFLPLVLGLLGRPRGWPAWSLVLAVGLSAAVFFYLRPFNFYGGGGALANRYLLPLYPAFWLLPGRPLRWPWIVATTAVASLFVAPLWLHPRAFPLMDHGRYAYVSPVANRILPYETTQSHLKPGGRSDVMHHGLWIKFLNCDVWPVEDAATLRLRESRSGGQLLVGYPTPLAAIDVELRAPPGARVVVTGSCARVEKTAAGPDRLRIVLSRPRARHPMWWTWEPFQLYRLTFRLENAGGRTASLRLGAAGEVLGDLVASPPAGWKSALPALAARCSARRSEAGHYY